MKVWGLLEQAQFELLAGPGDPALAPQGRVYFNQTSNTCRYYDGTAWHTVANADGVATNSSAAAGFVGELITAVNSSGASLTTVTLANVTSVSLTAGDWDVWACVAFIPTSWSSTIQEAGISTSISTMGAQFYDGSTIQSMFTTTTSSTSISKMLGPIRVSLSGTTTYYLNAQATFSAGSCKGYGTLFARRRR